MPPVTDQGNLGEATGQPVEPHSGKLAILIAGLGALGTSAIANCLLARKRSQSVTEQFREVVARALPPELSLTPLPANLRSPGVPLADLEFGGWDVFAENPLKIQRLLCLVNSVQLDSIAGELRRVIPMRAVFYPEYVKGFAGSFFKRGSKADRVQEVMDDIKAFQLSHGCKRAVVVWCGTSEKVPASNESHLGVKQFGAGLLVDDPAISSSQMYAWAAVRAGAPFVCAAPNKCIDFPAIRELAREMKVPLAGENIRAVHPGPGVPESDLQPPLDDDPKPDSRLPEPEFPPEVTRATAPLIIDTALWVDMARRAGLSDIQEWLDIYFENPIHPRSPAERASALAQFLAQ